MQFPLIDFHPSAREKRVEEEIRDSIRSNRINPKLLYLTARQTELWRQVFLRHSPIHSNPEFARIYQEAYEKIGVYSSTKKLALIGLGCGTGLKESGLFSCIKNSGRQVVFAAIDVSRDLVVESAQKLIAEGAEHRRSLVCDLSEATFLADWLQDVMSDLPRVITFFGLVPNLEPSLVMRLFRSVLRPGDILLVSAHLAAVGEGRGLPEAMQSVLPQYNNSETLAWLAAALEHLGLQERLQAPAMRVGEIEGIPAFVAEARWNSNETFEIFGHHYCPQAAEPLWVFHSLRYTPAIFETMLRKADFQVELLAQTECREEAIWEVRV